jgi:hypothetical protein
VDASNDVDATSDAADANNPSDASDASSAHYCALHATASFCADFDESADAASGFTSTYIASGGVLALDDAEFSSAPASLKTGNTLLDASTESTHAAEVVNTTLTPTSSITLDFDVKINSLASQGTVIEAFAMVLEASPRSAIQLNLKTASSEVGEEILVADGGKNYIPHVFSTALAMSSWQHVSIALAFAAPRSITVTVDANVVVDHASMDPSFSLGAVDLYVGNAYSPGPSSGAVVLYDNVLLAVK